MIFFMLISLESGKNLTNRKQDIKRIYDQALLKYGQT